MSIVRARFREGAQEQQQKEGNDTATRDLNEGHHP